MEKEDTGDYALCSIISEIPGRQERREKTTGARNFWRTWSICEQNFSYLQYQQLWHFECCSFSFSDFSLILFCVILYFWNLRITLQTSCLEHKALIKCNEKCLGTGFRISGDLKPAKPSIVSKRTFFFEQVQCWKLFQMINIRSY